MKNPLTTNAMDRYSTLGIGGGRSVRILLAALMLTGTVLSTYAADLNKNNGANVDPALVDAIVHKLESDGILDKAVEQAIGRVIARREEAQRTAQARKQVELQERAKAVRKVSMDSDHIRGNQSAELSLIEYSDFECPFCKGFHATPPALLSRFGKQVNWVYRHFPLDFHEPAARREAVAAECAGALGGNDMFWQYADALYVHTRSNGQGLPDDFSMEKLASQFKLDSKRFSQCVADGKVMKRVETDIAEGTAVGIQGTPTTLIRNNRTGATEVVVGAQSLDALVPVIERLLNGK